MTSALPRSTVAGTAVAIGPHAARGLAGGRVYSASIAAARAKSRSVMPEAACVLSVIRSRL